MRSSAGSAPPFHLSGVRFKSHHAYFTGMCGEFFFRDCGSSYISPIMRVDIRTAHVLFDLGMSRQSYIVIVLVIFH